MKGITVSFNPAVMSLAEVKYFGLYKFFSGQVFGLNVSLREMAIGR